MILTRYFIRETIKFSLSIIGGLLVLYLTMRLAAALGDAADGKMAPQHIVRMVGLKMLVSLRDLLPMSLFLGTFAAATRLQLGSEWVVMRAAGISHQHLMRPLLGVSLATSALVAIITLVLAPQAEHYLRDLKEITENEATIDGVKAGRFRDLAGGRRVFYAETIADDEKHLERAFVHSRDKKAEFGHEGAMRSDRASIEVDRRTHARFAVFDHGTSYAGLPGELEFTITDFSRYGARIEDPEPTNFNDHIGFVLTADLLNHKEYYYGVELQSRFSLPICTLFCPALAFLIGVGNRRGYWYLGLMAAVASYFAYTNLLGVGRALLLKGVIPHQLGMLPVHALFMLALGLLFSWHRRLLRIRPMRRAKPSST